MHYIYGACTYTVHVHVKLGFTPIPRTPPVRTASCANTYLKVLGSDQRLESSGPRRKHLKGYRIAPKKQEEAETRVQTLNVPSVPPAYSRNAATHRVQTRYLKVLGSDQRLESTD